MSLYIFGKLIPRVAFDYAKFRDRHRFLRLDAVDPFDVEGLDAAEELAASGFYFAICDDRQLDATRLWIDAMTAANRGASSLETLLGAEVHSILTDEQIAAGGIAFVDGGIETTLRGSRVQCWKWYEERIRRSWDAIDNPLLVWT